jgi:hypothetical protein
MTLMLSPIEWSNIGRVGDRLDGHARHRVHRRGQVRWMRSSSSTWLGVDERHLGRLQLGVRVRCRSDVRQVGDVVVD